MQQKYLSITKLHYIFEFQKKSIQITDFFIKKII